MKIANADLTLSAQHTAFEQHEIEESLKISRQGDPAASNNTSASVTLSQAGLSLLHEETAETNPKTPPPATTLNAAPATDETKALNLNRQIDNDPRLNLMRLAIEMLTGRKVSSLDAEFHDPQEAESASVSYERRETYTEFEQTNFAAEGIVNTTDGREIRFSVQLSMLHYFSEENYLSVNVGQTKDPLALNFSGTAAALSDARFSFDLDSDSHDEDMSMLARGSGFLVFDRNDDSKVNDGRELFGAIALQNAETPFSIKDLANQLQAQIRSTGIFLKENGGVGTVQKIDLVV